MRLETIQEAERRAAEIKARGATKLYYFGPQRVKTEKPEIMIGARDMGTARLAAPVIKELLRRGYPVSLLTDQPAESFLKKELPTMEELMIISPLGAIAKRNPGLILSGVSINGGAGIESYLVNTAQSYGEEKKNRVPVIWMEDYWGTATRKEQLSRGIKPDYIFGFDEYSKALGLAHFKEAGIKEFSPDRFIVTGSPAFDELFREKERDAIRKKVRDGFGLSEGEMMIVYMGAIPPEDIENLKILVDNLNKISLGDKEIALAVRLHPHIFSTLSLSKYEKEYATTASAFNNGRLIKTTEKFSTDELVIAADAVVSQLSTEGVKNVYRGKPSLFMLLPGLGRDVLKKEVGIEALPVIESGASIGVFREKDMKQGLEKLLDPKNQASFREAQFKHHNLDGQNTKKVVDLVEKILIEFRPEDNKK